MSKTQTKVWMPLYWGDYLRDTSHLSAAEHGAYLLLLGHYWVTGRPLPDDDRQLARIGRMTPDEWAESRPILVEFFTIEAGTWISSRMEAELGKAEGKVRARKSAGTAGGRSRWASDESVAEGKRNRSERLANARRLARHSPDEWQALASAVGGKCLRCGSDKIVKDHIVPIYQGGSDGIDNIQPLCRRCNASKGPDTTDLRPADWRERMAERLAKRLANDWQTPTPSQSQSDIYSDTGVSGGRPPAAGMAIETGNVVKHPATGGAPPVVDPAAVIFGQGVALLVLGGQKPGAARSLLGRWRKEHGDGAVIEALHRAHVEAASDPVAFIGGIFRARASPSAPQRSAVMQEIDSLREMAK